MLSSSPIQELIKYIEDCFNDKCYQTILLGILSPKKSRFFLPDELKAFEAFAEHSSSKKSQVVRRNELLKIVMKPLETFLEENLQFYLLECNKNYILRALLSAIVESINIP